jgi:hypothetical protein
MYEGNLSTAESALADLAVARAMLPDSPMVLIHEVFAASVAQTLAEGPDNVVKRENYSRQAGQAARKLRNVDTGSAAHARLLIYEDTTAPPEQALAELRSAAERFGGPHLVEHYALQLFVRGRSGEALEFLDRKGPVEFWMEPTRAMILADVPDGLRRARDAMAKEMGDDAQASPMYLPALLLLGDLARAEGLARRAVEAPDAVPIYMRATVVTFARHVIGQISEAELFKYAQGSRQRRSLVNHHLGLLRLARGDRVGAKEYFRETAEAGVFYLRETARSRALLARLEADPQFPQWITR